MSLELIDEGTDGGLGPQGIAVDAIIYLGNGHAQRSDDFRALTALCGRFFVAASTQD
jgi:hypothetical protein